MKNPFFRNVEFVKTRAKDFIEALGYVYLGCEGADYGIFYGGSVWIQAKRLENQTLIYTIRLRRQGDDLKLTFYRIVNDIPSVSISNVASSK